MRRMMLGMSQEKLGDGLSLTFQQAKNTRRHQPDRRQPAAADFQYPAGPGGVLFEGAPNLHGTSDGMKEARSPAYVSISSPAPKDLH